MLHSLLIFLYSLLTLVLSAFVAPLFLFHPRGRRRLSERWGIGPDLPDECIWMHGASVGEVMGLLPLIRALRSKGVSLPIVLTSTSPSGLERGKLDADIIRLLPFDSIWLYRLFLKDTRVRLFIGAETELWPSLLYMLDKKSVPIVCANAVISDFTMRRYARASFLFRPLLQRVTVCCADEISRDRFAMLGVPASALFVTGSAKYDSMQGEFLDPDPILNNYMEQEGRQALVFGSLRDGEEADFAPLIARVLEAYPTLVCVIAPRHMEHKELAYRALEDAGVDFVSYTALQETSAAVGRCLVLDVMGRLMDAYALATLAYVGGSLHAGAGGHNPLEPACCRVPVAMGPHYEKQLVPVHYLQEQDAIEIVSSPQGLYQWVERLLADESLRLQQGEAAYQAYERAIGATERIMERLQPLLEELPGTGEEPIG